MVENPLSVNITCAGKTYYVINLCKISDKLFLKDCYWIENQKKTKTSYSAFGIDFLFLYKLWKRFNLPASMNIT